MMIPIPGRLMTTFPFGIGLHQLGQARVEGGDALLGPQHLRGDLGDKRRLGLGGWQLVALGLGCRDYPAGELLRAVNTAGLQPSAQAGLAEPAGGYRARPGSRRRGDPSW